MEGVDTDVGGPPTEGRYNRGNSGVADVADGLGVALEIAVIVAATAVAI